MTRTLWQFLGQELRTPRKKRGRTDVAGEERGAPWWFTLVVALTSIAITHCITTWRERSKNKKEWRDRWVSEVRVLITKISDASVQHYVDAQSLADTSRSAGLIVSDLKRLGQLLREAVCIESGDTKKTMDVYRAYHAEITGPEDFQDPGRIVKGVNDDVCEGIRDLEAQLVSWVKKPRRPKDV
jgi:hypothetical protein